MEARIMPTGVSVLKWYFIVIGIIFILVGAIAMPFIAVFFRVFMQAAGEFESFGMPSGGLLAYLYVFWGFVAILWGVFHVFIGVHLGKGNGWARIAALITGTISLFANGGILGILCLFIYLLSQESKAYFQR
ncbi:MAG: hypothetical protein ACE5JA_00900 [bacterium]